MAYMKADLRKINTEVSLMVVPRDDMYFRPGQDIMRNESGDFMVGLFDQAMWDLELLPSVAPQKLHHNQVFRTITKEGRIRDAGVPLLLKEVESSKTIHVDMWVRGGECGINPLQTPFLLDRLMKDDILCYTRTEFESIRFESAGVTVSQC